MGVLCIEGGFVGSLYRSLIIALLLLFLFLLLLTALVYSPAVDRLSTLNLLNRIKK